MGTTGYHVRAYDLDGNGKRSFAWVRFEWVRELRFITGPVPFPVPVEIPREKYRGNIPARSLAKYKQHFVSTSSRSETARHVEYVEYFLYQPLQDATVVDHSYSSTIQIRSSQQFRTRYNYSLDYLMLLVGTLHTSYSDK